MLQTTFKYVIRLLTEHGYAIHEDDSLFMQIVEYYLRSRAETIALAYALVKVSYREKQISVRGVFYRIVSEGWAKSTNERFYQRISALLTDLRRGAELIPHDWIIDSTRIRDEYQMFPNLNEYEEFVKKHYARNPWQDQNCNVEIFSEKMQWQVSCPPLRESIVFH